MLTKAKALTLEVNALTARTQGLTESVQKLTAERNALLPRQEEVIDELKSEIVISKSSTASMKSFVDQAENWMIMQNGSAGLGVILIFVGFILWYRRIQRHQDALLRKQVGDQ